MSFLSGSGLFYKDTHKEARLPAPHRPPAACALELQARGTSSATVMTIRGPIDRESLEDVCVRAGLLLGQTDSHPVICDVGGVVAPDAVAVDGLARLQLTARRLGLEMKLRGVPAHLQELLELTGLEGVLPSEKT